MISGIRTTCKLTGYSLERAATMLAVLAGLAGLAGYLIKENAYFPSITDPFVRDWYKSQLKGLREEPLTRSDKTRVLRFTLLRTFDQPICVRVEIPQGQEATLTSKASSGAGGYSPGDLCTHHQYQLSPSDKEKVLSMLSSESFWKTDDSVDPRYAASDGSRWIFESWDGGAYHFVQQDTPSHGQLREAGILLMARGDILPLGSELY